MNLYLISQEVNNDYDTFDSAVVVAKDADAAKKIHPEYSRYGRLFEYTINDEGSFLVDGEESPSYSTWVQNISQVQVKPLGVAVEELEENTVVCASFNAG